MNEDTGVHYLTPWKINETIEGLGGIGEIIEILGNVTDLNKGDIVTCKSLKWPWQTHFIADSNDLEKVPLEMHNDLPKFFSCIGLIGLTVLLGIRKKGGLDLFQSLESPLTFVVSGAAGACGILAGQIARLEGATRIIGICGSDKKCNILRKEFGYDVAINYKTENVYEKLKNENIQCYFDNVGGEISDAVVKNMVSNGNIILCGQISQYNKDVPYPPPLSQVMEENLKLKNIQRERFLVLNYADEFDESLQQLTIWLQNGKLKTMETIVHGIENTGIAFVDMMSGSNIGKQIVKI